MLHNFTKQYRITLFSHLYKVYISGKTLESEASVHIFLGTGVWFEDPENHFLTITGISSTDTNALTDETHPVQLKLANSVSFPGYFYFVPGKYFGFIFIYLRIIFIHTLILFQLLLYSQLLLEYFCF